MSGEFENLFLVGPMGAGKTTIGRQLASIMKMDFIDSDHEIVRRTGASIPLIFDVEGENGFRKREADVIADLSSREGIVMATGGGAVVTQENRENLKARGVVIYLYASIEQLLQRTARDRNRPLLQTDDPKAKLEELMRQRDPLYREVADMIIHTEDRSVRSVVKEIKARLQRLKSSTEE